MKYFDPHIHCVSRTTDDYENMFLAGVRAVVEPAFWMGQPRTYAGTFFDYFLSIIEFERTRAADFGISHRCTIGLNPKEANNEKLAAEVLERLPEFLCRESVVAAGELGFDSINAAEERALRLQVQMAMDHDLAIMVHTPHRDKYRGTVLLMDILDEMGVNRNRCVIDHSTEETTALILDRGYWAGHTVYPQTKLTPERFANIYNEFGIERITLNTSADWGKSDPLLLPKTCAYLERRGADRETLQKLVWDNPVAFYGAEKLALPVGCEPFDPITAQATHSKLPGAATH